MSPCVADLKSLINIVERKSNSVVGNRLRIGTKVRKYLLTALKLTNSIERSHYDYGICNFKRWATTYAN